jgi:hypothetical protein
MLRKESEAMKKKIVMLLGASLMSAVLLAGCGKKEEPAEEPAVETTAVEEAAEEEVVEETAPLAELEYWTEDSAAAASLREYVEAVTDESSDRFIPEEDRIAVFDLDGTIIGELYPSYFEYMMFIHRALYDDTYDAPWDVKAFGAALEEGIRTGSYPENSERLHAEYAGKAYAGMTPDELIAYTKAFMNTEAEGFVNLTRGEAFYKPMVSLVEYLDAYGFTVYIVSGSDRTVVRGLIEDKLPIPVNHVIGMSYNLIATGQSDIDGLDYLYTADDQVIRGNKLTIKTIKMNKVSEIALEIGKVPVLAFGNSSGDLSMAQYVENNDQYEGRAYLVLCDDTGREYGSQEKADSLKQFCDEHGFETISMRDDFATIYGDDVIIVPKTEEAATEETTEEAAAEEATEEVAEEAAEEAPAEEAAEEAPAEETAEEAAAEEAAEEAPAEEAAEEAPAEEAVEEAPAEETAEEAEAA